MANLPISSTFHSTSWFLQHSFPQPFPNYHYSFLYLTEHLLKTFHLMLAALSFELYSTDYEISLKIIKDSGLI